jgi:hypothetical protein
MEGSSGVPKPEEIREVMSRLAAIHAKYMTKWADLRRRQTDLLRRVSEQLDRENLNRAMKSLDDIKTTER